MRKISKDAFVVIGHCLKHGKGYGITVDKLGPGRYAFVWAFALDKEKAAREGFGRESVRGNVVNDAEYPGCPYCGTKAWAICGCGTVMCHNGERVVTCPSCGRSGEVVPATSFNLNGGAM